MTSAETSLPPALAAEDEVHGKRVKERIYVTCQAGGWGAILVLQLALTNAMAKNRRRRVEAGDASHHAGVWRCGRAHV